MSSADTYGWDEGRWAWNNGFSDSVNGLHVVALDYGVKKNILRCLVEAGCRVSVLPANSKADDVLALSPDGDLCGR